MNNQNNNNNNDNNINLSKQLYLNMSSEHVPYFINEAVSSKYYEQYINLFYNVAEKYYSKEDEPAWGLVKFTFKLNKYEFIQPQHVVATTKETFYKSKYENRILRKTDLIDINQPYETIVKYHPLTTAFFFYYEIIYNFDLIKNNDNILLIDNYTPFIEACYHYGKKNIKLNLLYLSHYTYQDKQKSNINEIFDHIKQYITFNTIFYDKPINDSYFNHDLDKKYDVICCAFAYQNKLIDKIWTLADIYNIPFFLANIIYSLKHLNDKGNLVIYFRQIYNTAVADLALICKTIFEETYLYHPKIHNLIKFTGTVGIFKGYKGTTYEIIKKLINMFEEYYKYDPTLTNKFNTKDENTRKYLRITKPIDNSYEIKYINGFLKDTTDKDYEFIRLFNERILMKKIKFIKKIEKILNMDPEQQNKYLEKKERTS